MSNYFSFFTNTNKLKPRTISSKDNNKPPCPFCDYKRLSELQNVVLDLGESLLVENLFPTIEDCFQTVFIETKDCDANFTNYDKETLNLVFKNLILSYLELKKLYPKDFIVGLKNSGEFSSGSIHHQHMQLLSFKRPLDKVDAFVFDGEYIFNDDFVKVNFSEKPLTEFYEINLRIPTEELFKFESSFEKFANCLQTCIQYTLSTITTNNSYNLAFYFEEDELIVKIIPRNSGKSVSHTTVFLAFNIHLVPDNIDSFKNELSEQLKKHNR